MHKSWVFALVLGALCCLTSASAFAQGVNYDPGNPIVLEWKPATPAENACISLGSTVHLYWTAYDFDMMPDEDGCVWQGFPFESAISITSQKDAGSTFNLIQAGSYSQEGRGDLTLPSTPTQDADHKSYITLTASDVNAYGGDEDDTTHPSITRHYWAVGIDDLQYKIGTGAYAVVPDPLCIVKGTTVEFKAIKDPAAAPSWPAGKPAWGGTGGATGTGETKSITFHDAGSFTVTAECGGTVTANVIPFAVIIDTPAAFPTYVAKGATLQLGCTITPAGAAGGTFAWSKASGPGNVTFGPNATAEDPTFSANAAGEYTNKCKECANCGAPC